MVETLFLGLFLAVFGWGYISGHRAGEAKQRIKTERIVERMLNH